MSKKIFINIPVSDLEKSKDFYTSIGFVNNPTFTDNTAACMVLTEEIFVMLLTHDKFREFTRKPIGDTTKVATVINGLSVDSNNELNTIMKNAIDAGGREYNEAKDYGFMLQRSFEDLDGHLWEVLYMDMSKLPNQ